MTTKPPLTPERIAEIRQANIQQPDCDVTDLLADRERHLEESAMFRWLEQRFDARPAYGFAYALFEIKVYPDETFRDVVKREMEKQ